ncbi:MAG: FGGY-family carbohydrate kinase, partial [Alphaproteobacteria bacterium]
PKLIWLKRHLSSSWQKFAYLFDLADFLVWRAAGSNIRSQCTVTCKWTYLAHEDPGWQAGFLNGVGLDDLMSRAAMPARAEPIGHAAGNLTQAAAQQLGLTTACIVAVGLIDAHAGTLGVLGQSLDEPATLDRHIAMIAGTSTCHMALATQARTISGVWGPYFGAVAPGLWLNEGGQSASGALLDHILHWHAEGRTLGADAHRQVLARIDALRAQGNIDDFAHDLHVLPDFHGNRSPLADPTALGAIFGLTLDASFDSLARLYYATAAAIALGTRHILEAMNETGYRIDTLHLSGGHGKNPLLLSLYADTTGCEVVLAEEEDGVLLGTAMVAALGAGLHADLGSAGKAMARVGRTVSPDAARRPAHDRRYAIMRLMQDQSAALRAL